MTKTKGLQRTYAAILSPTIKDLHWAAGFIEGEGTFRKTRTRSCTGKMSGTEQVAVVQVNTDPVGRLLMLFGGSCRKWKSRAPKNPNQQAAWTWVVSGARARGVMLTLYPLLSYKRQQQIRKALGLDFEQCW